MTEFKVGDRVKTTRSCPNQTSFCKGKEFVIGAEVTRGIYTYYVPYGLHDSWNTRVTGTNLVLIDRPAAPRTINDMTKEEFGEHVAKVARKYADEHGWCEVVDDALVEMGLGEFVTKYVEVSFSVRVPAAFDVSDSAVSRVIQAAFGVNEVNDLTVYS